MRALGALADHPPSIEGLPGGDFWTILGKYMSKGFQAADAPRMLCEEHLIARYRPQMGAPDNLDRLIEDIQACPAHAPIAVSTTLSCWTDSGLEECARCKSAVVTRIYECVEPGGSSNQLADVWRDAYRAEHPSDFTLLEKYSPDMFPAIEFSRDAFSRLNSLAGAPEEMVGSIISHLAVLNDSGPEIWKNEITSHGRQAVMRAKGVTASLEGPRTHKNLKAMKERDFRFEGGVVRCEWHTKLRPEINRIYFAVEADKVLVGRIVDHLPT